MLFVCVLKTMDLCAGRSHHYKCS